MTYLSWQLFGDEWPSKTVTFPHSSLGFMLRLFRCLNFQTVFHFVTKIYFHFFRNNIRKNPTEMQE